MTSISKQLAVFLLITVAFPSVATCMAQSKADPNQRLWEDTRKLLLRREYALAVNVLENSLDDPEFFEHTRQLQVDLDGIKLLKKLSEIVEYQTQKLPQSAPLTVLSKPMRFKSFERDDSGETVVLTNFRGDDVSYPLHRLGDLA